MIESFFGTLKAEYFHLAATSSIDALEAGVNDYVHYYNHIGSFVHRFCMTANEWTVERVHDRSGMIREVVEEVQLAGMPSRGSRT